MNTNKPWIAIASISLSIAALSASPLGHAAGQMILPKSSVGTVQLKSGAVTGLKVKDGSLAAADFAAGQIPAGPKGDKGDKGDTGSPGMSGYQVVTGTAIGVNPGQVGTSVANCPSGKKAIGGSFSASNYLIRVGESIPTGNLDGWSVSVRNDSAVQAQFIARAVCAYVG